MDPESHLPDPYPASAVCANYDLHVMAGGLPLLVLAASNVHLSSKRRREACNPTKEVKHPYSMMWVQMTHHAPSRKKLLFGLRVFVERIHDQLIHSFQFSFVFNGAEDSFAVLVNGFEDADL